ncbi:MAG TPA: VWA domain-containing protein [Edaphobacter sp.]|jgi:VWFA-related protein|nr:VWA domain-containing protein [Edaphobacter sp.]
MMIPSGALCGLLVAMLMTQTRAMGFQIKAAEGQDLTSYRLKVPVDEVSLSFHATDRHGFAVNDLKLEELQLLDNDRPPLKIAAFEPLQNASIRAGILMDTSESMRDFVARNRAISIEYAQKLLRQQTDQAFVTEFGYLSAIVQPWTSDPAALAAGLRRVSRGKENPLGGTALFDAIYRTCFFEFGKIDRGATGNFILLFSDGEDNVSHLSLKEVVDACQRTNTAIYSFRAEPKESLFSGSATTLAELAAKTGGRVFHDNGSEEEIYDDLRVIEDDVRSQYWLVYKPAGLKHDGSFHRIELKAPERVDKITVRSGYYAPAH